MIDVLRNILIDFGNDYRDIGSTICREEILYKFYKTLKEEGYVIHNSKYSDVNYLDEVELEEPEKRKVVYYGTQPEQKEKVLQNAINKTPIPLDDNFKDTQQRFADSRMVNAFESTRNNLSERKLEDINPEYAEKLRLQQEELKSKGAGTLEKEELDAINEVVDKEEKVEADVKEEPTKPKKSNTGLINKEKSNDSKKKTMDVLSKRYGSANVPKGIKNISESELKIAKQKSGGKGFTKPSLLNKFTNQNHKNKRNVVGGKNRK